MLAVRLPEDIEKKLVDLAEKTGRTKTYYAREAIIEHLEDLEDYYLAVHRLENPPERTWSLEELEQEVDLEG
ncbi:type II toxin-antitoxin system RelB family antitoxin [Desulfonatronovibrio magnus]|uniref:type II toxin-antitoxin system RelB family antitoxin n=1 Tax=Desulfonatronovibrio magnus TaxID=698827 RepID=UPI0005EAF829|nr:TraY domain-containing protein [Desulfonatronovibrio magnus]